MLYKGQEKKFKGEVNTINEVLEISAYEIYT